MNFKTTIVIISLIIIGGCLIQIAIHKKPFEGFTNFINDENNLSFNQIKKKYSYEECSTTPYDIGSYVEVYNSNDPIEQSILNVTEYDSKWKSAEVVSYVNGTYKVKYQDGDVEDVEENLVKSHHQNECNISNCGIKDNECSNDCAEPNDIGGDCMPIQTGKDSNDNDIKYKVCPRICRNDDKDNSELECGYHNCCKGCGFSVFQINDNSPNDDDTLKTSQVMYRLKKIPYDSQSYEIDETYDYATEMEKEAKRVNDAMAAASSSPEETDEPAINSGSETSTTNEPETEVTEPVSVTEDVINTTDSNNTDSNNVVNAFVDNDECWVGPTGHESFMYCGPAPFSF
tara:strand:+ start:232 stop:1263 length:1032 start_codon:yes stop_codon:yes gene_type:complete